eukprot:364316-Chlamydomonas_euryale.AAC.5
MNREHSIRVASDPENIRADPTPAPCSCSRRPSCVSQCTRGLCMHACSPGYAAHALQQALRFCIVSGMATGGHTMRRVSYWPSLSERRRSMTAVPLGMPSIDFVRPSRTPAGRYTLTRHPCAVGAAAVSS